MPGDLILSDAHVSLSDGDRVFRLEVDKLTLQPGKAIALTGDSGSGKTLLLELLGLLRRPGQGSRYRYDGDNPTDLSGLWRAGARSADLAQLRGRLFGFVPQSGGLMPFLTVAENIALPQKLNNRVDPDWCRSLIAALRIEDVTGLYPGALSIGQRQRTAIARALAHRPGFVIADEPTAALDSDSADAVLEQLLDMSRAHNSGVILSSHDTARIARFGLSRLHLSVTTDGSEVISTPKERPC